MLPYQDDSTVAMDFTIDSHSHVPPFQQVIDAVLDAIAVGELPEGARLPSVRELAVQALVNPNTVAKAYRELGTRGVVQGRKGDGVYVTTEGPSISRMIRRESTIKRFRLASEHALRAGHPHNDLRGVLDDVKPKVKS